MKRFINPQSKTYHHAAVEDFSDTSKFLTSGLARGHNTIEYSWTADTLFKNTGNSSINPHAAYVSFFSDRDIMYQEFGNVQEVYDAYPFFSNWDRSIFPDISYELETKQYFKIGQRYSEFDLVEYFNASEYITTPVDEYRVEHQFYRSPVIHAEGYKLDMDNDGYESYDKYLWAINTSSSTTIDIDEYSLELNLYSGSISGEIGPGNYSIYNAHSGDPAQERILDYKINIDNPRFTFFEAEIEEWVIYPNETTHYQSGTYDPYYGFCSVYTTDSWTEQVPEQGYRFFPEVIIDNKLEPSKIITGWPSEATAPKGRLSFYSGVHLNDSEDQSRIVYNICRNMTSASGIYSVVEQTMDDSTVITGVDIDAERNRRYSAVVMTEPYFVTEPLGNGQLVEYSFVYADGSAVTNWSTGNNPMYLKVKSSLNIFSEMDSILNTDDRNTDIINVLQTTASTVKLVLATLGSDDYEDFANADFYTRQDYCLDDLVGGIVGTGNYKKFFIDLSAYTSFSNADKYSDSEIKVCGLGLEYSNGNELLNFYCTNYIPSASPIPGVTETPQTPDSVEILTDSSEVTRVLGAENFKPMINLPGMNGYIKIMSKNSSFSVTRDSDGKYVTVYNVEFPYCPGSKTVRDEMDFSSTETLTGFIYKKKSYINAGSHEVDGTQASPIDERYDAGNDRYAPYGDDSFGKTEILFQAADSGFITTDPFNKGGGFNDLTSSTKNQINYPADLVWETKSSVWDIPDLFVLTKPRFSNHRRYGTYEINFDDDEGLAPTSDMKIMTLVDNRQWKFAEDKYVSYIGRENPSYVFEIDASFLSDSFTEFQAMHGSIPDVKRWLYGYFTGFSHVLLSQDITLSSTDTEKLETMGNNSDMLSDEAKSDMVVEIWDQESDTGNDQTGNWRPFMSTSNDNHKIPGSLIVDNIFITDVSAIGDDDINNDFEDIYSMYIGYFERDEFSVPSFVFPDNVDYAGSNDLLDGKQNLVLYDTESNVSLHIVYIERVNDPLYGSSVSSAPQQVYKAYVKKPDSYSFETIDISDVESDVEPQYTIRNPYKTLEKNPRFSTNSIIATNGIEDGFLTKFIDAQSDGDPSDSERFIVSDKIYFRVRINRGKEYPSSYESQDSSEIPYLGDGVADDGLSVVEKGRLNFPWYDSLGVIETAFDWTKVKIEETIRKFGLNYFKCASK